MYQIKKTAFWNENWPLGGHLGLFKKMTMTCIMPGYGLINIPCIMKIHLAVSEERVQTDGLTD